MRTRPASVTALARGRKRALKFSAAAVSRSDSLGLSNSQTKCVARATVGPHAALAVAAQEPIWLRANQCFLQIWQMLHYKVGPRP